jgi:DNA-binding NarL/FixJ family response regulator
VILLDYRLPGLDGVQVARLVREACPEVAIVVLTAAAQEREIEALLEQGAVACVGKDESLDTIVDAIRRAAAVETG